MARQRQWQGFRQNSMAIVDHAQQRLAAIGIGHFDPGGLRIKRVFNKLLDRRGGPLNHFARCNPVDCGLVELANNRQTGRDIGVVGDHDAKP